MNPPLRDGPSKLELIACEDSPNSNRFLRTLSKSDFRWLSETWAYNARLGQLAPDGAWRTWIMLGGRGAGKTRAGAEWVRGEVEAGRARRIALAGPSLHDVREVMIEGESGLRRLPGERPRYEATRRRLVWANGAEAHVLSAMDPDNFRGPQFDAAWADEFCVWPNASAALATLRMALRLGKAPRLVVTTTPKPSRDLQALIGAPGSVSWRVPTRSNAANLAEGFVEEMQAQWSGSAFGRQELEGELLDAPEGALWSREMIEQVVVSEWPALEEIIVAVDPPASEGARADCCGIVVVGAYGDRRRAVVLADASVQGLGPSGWAARAMAQARAHDAMIVAEANNGGEMVRSVLQQIDADIPVLLVHARDSKRMRAQVAAALYESGRIAHAGRFAELEDEMCRFGAAEFTRSPDRLDALVWALDHLIVKRADPRVRRA